MQLFIWTILVHASTGTSNETGPSAYTYVKKRIATDGGQASCGLDGFSCQDGSCISKKMTCNSNVDCKNGEDESVALCGCLPNEFACAKNDTCIALLRRCDRSADCPDAEDEENCDTYVCPESHVKCIIDHTCIHKDLMCDFFLDCPNGSDEVGCPRSCWVGEFRCNNGECIPPGFVCDGVADCLDASDEIRCRNETCLDGRRIHESYRCNGWPDCEITHVDELGCEKCNNGQHMCANGRCISKSHVCDGICDCLRSCDDEVSCDKYYTKRNGWNFCATGTTIRCNFTINGESKERCIAAEFICDGIDDCHTGRDVSLDETGCDEYSLRDEDKRNMFSCLPPDSRWMPLSVRCDHYPDCLHADDEIHCPPGNSSAEGEFRCANGQIILAEKRCDLQLDCYDKSDETDCHNFDCPEKKNVTLPDGGTLEMNVKRCTNGQCIAERMWCDFVKDCADGSDENTKYCKIRSCSEDEFSCRTLNQCIPSHLRCYDDGDRRAGCADRSHLQGCQDVVCGPGRFKCRNGPCIKESLRCDGKLDCDLVWNDEENCLYPCHNACTCVDRTLNCTGLGLRDLPQDIEDPFNKIYFGNNNIGDQISPTTFELVRSVIELDLSNNSITQLEPQVFRITPEVRILILKDNHLREIRNGTFDGLSLLTNLQLQGNAIESIETRGFYGLSSLTTLSLRLQNIKNISRGAFIGLSNLNKLDLSYNKLQTLADGTFIGLSRLKYLDLSHNSLVSIDRFVFHSLLALNNLIFDEFRFCCSARRIRRCLPAPDEFSSCEDLMSNFILRICVWLLGIIATFGNLLVITWRIRYQHSNRVHSFLITNLAIGDLLMGVYLIMIAATDAKYRGEYSVFDKVWRTSRLCALAGFLSTLSSELSVFTLTVITLDRFLAIIFPFRFTRLEMRQTVWVMLGVWLVAVLISALPLFDLDYFRDFYGRSGVCLALHITPDKPNGWEYSVFIFLVINLVSFSIIAFGYVTMYGAAKTTSLAVGRHVESKRAEAAMARRMTLIVATDAACWVPIILLGILSLFGITVPKQVFAWVAVFVLPLNAAVNPVLYTISTTPFLDPATKNIRHLNRSLRLSCTDNRSHRTCSTNFGASSSPSGCGFRCHIHKKFHHRGGSSYHFQNNWKSRGDMELTTIRSIRQKQRSEDAAQNRGRAFRCSLSQLDEDDSDYESESFNDSSKVAEGVIIERWRSEPQCRRSQGWLIRSSDSESAEEQQHCCNHSLANSRQRYGKSYSEGCEPREKDKSLWPLGRKKKKRRRELKELYD